MRWFGAAIAIYFAATILLGAYLIGWIVSALMVFTL